MRRLIAAAVLVGCTAKPPDRSCVGDRACAAACEHENQAACTKVARRLRDDVKAHALLTRACAADDADGCAELAARYRVGRGVRRDAAQADVLSAKARRRYERECKNGGGWGCLRSANQLQAFILGDKGCEAKDLDACELLGATTASVSDDAQKLPLNMSRFRFACAGGSATGCLHAGEPRRAALLYGKRCDAGDAEACLALGEHWLDRPIDVLSKDPADPFGRACDLGELAGCTRAANALGWAWSGRAANPERARVFAQRRIDALVAECQQSPGQACLETGQPALEQRGLEALEKRCANEDGWACRDLAVHRRSHELAARACELTRDAEVCATRPEPP